jgi:hypothetical protein
MERICLECQKPIKGRADKKFCDDNCRSSYNNLRKAADNNFVKSINQILKKNRSILKENNPTDKIKINRSRLVRQGYNFDFHTHTYTNKKEMTYFFCYEYGYLTLAHGEVLLVRKSGDFNLKKG